MRHFFSAEWISVCGILLLVTEAQASPSGLAELDRTLLKEPTYEATPKYSLLVIGSGAEVKVWIVEDGKRLFVDRNANGDLTDDGSPIQRSDVRSVGAKGWDFN